MGIENMKICIVSFTKNGYKLSCDIAHKLEKSEYEVEVFTKCSRLSDENIKNSPMKIIEIPATYHKIYQTGQLHR